MDQKSTVNGPKNELILDSRTKYGLKILLKYTQKDQKRPNRDQIGTNNDESVCCQSQLTNLFCHLATSLQNNDNTYSHIGLRFGRGQV